MSKEMYKGIAIGLIISAFLIQPILGVVGLGGITMLFTIGLAAYLYFIKK